MFDPDPAMLRNGLLDWLARIGKIPRYLEALEYLESSCRVPDVSMLQVLRSRYQI